MTEPVIEYQPQPAPRSARRTHLLILLAITLFGGVLRFACLSKPALWGDEAMTYARTCSDYQDLIDRLQFDGFVPLHYELYQWIHDGMPLWGHIKYDRPKLVSQQRGRGFLASFASAAPTSQPAMKRFLIADHPIVAGGVHMSPIVMRLPPAIAGTLMIPAMYFLAMQIIGRRAALVAAAFSACSAYLLVYSRDAKMYSELWLFATLSVACLLWWLRVRTRIAWLCWVASSVAMCGIHAPGAVLLAIELLIFLSYDRRWWIAGSILVFGFLICGLFHGQVKFGKAQFDTRWIFLGFVLISVIALYIWRRWGEWKAPVFFLLGVAIIVSGMGVYYLKFNRWLSEIDERNWNASMLQWVDEYTIHRDTSNFIAFPTTAYLLSWQWTQAKEEPFVDPRTLSLLHAAVYVSAALALAGLLPWRRWSKRSTLDGDEQELRPLGVRLLWIVGWIVVPAYGFYCVSRGSLSKLDKGVFTPGFASPRDWLAALGSGLQSLRWLNLIGVFAIAGVAYVTARTWRQRLFKSGGVLAALLIVLTLCGGSYLLIRDYNQRALAANGHWHSLWMPRYLGCIWPAFAIALAALLSRLPTRPIRYGAIAFVLAANLAQFGARVHESEPPTELIARDMLAASPSRTYIVGTFRTGWGAWPGEGLFQSTAWRYYMAELTDLKLNPQEFRTDMAAFNRVNKSVATNNTNWIAGDLKRSPQIREIVVWDKVDRGVRDFFSDDTLPQETAGTWKRIEEQTFDAFDHWTWQHLYMVRRRVYVKVGG